MDDEEELACCGTPLEDLDEDDVRSRKAPRVEDQIVTDKQGRRRFHGAFTGSFSAGYFNSVGTKEGWTPSAFVSSKGQRGEAKKARPMDFMDEEDMEAFGISPQAIQASANYDNSQQVKRKRVPDPGGPIPGAPVLEDLLRPNRETMGMKLLRRLGWRPGQGVGPRVSRRQKVLAQKEKQRMLGCQAPRREGRGSESDGSSDDSEGDEAHLQDVTFAPNDVAELCLDQPKMNRFGMGYTPLTRTSVLGGHINLFDPAPLALTEKKKKLLIKGQAFGVGAFEDEDEDIYSTEDMSNYEFGEEKRDSENRGQDRHQQQHLAMLGMVKVLRGFKLSSEPQHRPKVYPPPPLPLGFMPHHQPRRRRFERKESEVQGLGRHSLTAEQRAQAIRDKPTVTVEVRSGIKGQSQEPAKDSKQPFDISEVEKLYEEFKNSDKKLGSDFKPFARVPEKQKRYDLFLRMKERGQKDRFYLAQPKDMTEWEREREVQEFSRAAKLFQPLVSTMASRFVTAAASDNQLALKDGLNLSIPKPDPNTRLAEDNTLAPLAPGDDKMAAARTGMFGKLTQEVEDWHPDNLLCRRFNVPNPYSESSFVGVNKKKKKFSLFSSVDTATDSTAGLRTSQRREEEEIEGNQQEKMDDEDKNKLDDRPETYGLKVPVDGPPTMDLFKAIFQDSDSESDNEAQDASPGKTNETADLSQQGGSSSTISASSTSTAKESGSQEDDRKSTIDNFVETMRSTKSTKAEQAVSSSRQQRPRISRFEPRSENPTCPADDLPKPTFIARKKEEPNVSKLPVGKGIFADIDFEALNSYRNQDSVTIKKEEDNPARLEGGTKPSTQRQAANGNSSSSSTDSEDAYGPPVPSHLKNRAQMIRSTLPATPTTHQLLEKTAAAQQASGWVEREAKKNKSLKKHKHKARPKYKKEKKKKKDIKSKKHKEKKKKKKDHKSSSKRRSKSSSASESSTSDSD